MPNGWKINCRCSFHIISAHAPNWDVPRYLRAITLEGAFIEQTQSPLQRGFTKGSSSMNCSLILEEYIRESKGMKKDVYIVFLAAKSAFDVVDHASLM